MRSRENEKEVASYKLKAFVYTPLFELKIKMGNNSVYAYNNMILLTTAGVVSVILSLMSFVFLILLFRRKKLENQLRRAEKSATINHGHIPDYVEDEPQGLTVINEYPSEAISESKGEGYIGEQDQHTDENFPPPNERESIPSLSSPYHFNFNEETFVDGDVGQPIDGTRNTSSILPKAGEYPHEVEDAESDSDCDATFETTVT